MIKAISRQLPVAATIFVLTLGVKTSSVASTVSRMNLYKPILNADLIIVGKVTSRQWFDGTRVGLLEVHSPRVILDKKLSKGSTADIRNNVLILSDREYRFGSPIVEVGKSQTLFLKQIKLSPESAKKYGVNEDQLIFEICEGELSSAPSEFSAESAVSQSIQKSYEIQNGVQWVDSVIDLTSFENLVTKDEKINHLLKSFSANKEKKIYDATVPPLLASVIFSGDHPNAENGEVLMAVDEVTSPLPLRNSPYKRRYANGLLRLLNRKDEADYQPAILTLLSNLGLKPIASNGKFTFEVPGRSEASKHVGPLPE